MKKLPVIACVLFVLSVSACKEKENTAMVPGNHEGWSRTTVVELDYPIPGHESHYRRTYINSIGENFTVSLEDGKTVHEYPAGTIIIKDIYPGLVFENGDQPVMQTVMIKDPEHPHNRGGWVWIIKNLETGTETVMDDLFCLSCHSNANEQHPYGDKNTREEFRDYVFFPPERQ